MPTCQPLNNFFSSCQCSLAASCCLRPGVRANNSSLVFCSVLTGVANAWQLAAADPPRPNNHSFRTAASPASLHAKANNCSRCSTPSTSERTIIRTLHCVQSDTEQSFASPA